MIFRTIAVYSVLAGACFAGTPPATTLPHDNGSWAVFERYRSANAALKPDRSRVVFLGDSITEAWAKEPFISGNTHYVGRGVSGQTSLQMLVRFRADVIALSPQLVHVMAGTNDLAENNGSETDEEIEDAIHSMVELALANHIMVVLASVPPTVDFPWRPGLNPAPRIRRINQWIESYARQAGVRYVDYWRILATTNGAMKANLSEDGVHPSTEGYREMQPLAQAAIESALRIGRQP